MVINILKFGPNVNMSSLIFPANTTHAKDLSRKAKAGRIRKLSHGIYTDDLTKPAEMIIAEQWMEIVAHLIPGGILSFRTALELAPARDQESGNLTVFVTSTYSKQIVLVPLIIKVSPGDITNYTEPVLPNLKRSNIARALLENLSATRQRKGVAKSLSQTAIEARLAKILEHQGGAELNRIGDEAKVIAEHLGMSKALLRLNSVVNALLSSNARPSVLRTDSTSAVGREPYDSARVALFEALAVYLRRCTFKNRQYIYNQSSWRTLSFFESYFSNYIEGTKFLIDEAENIVFQGTAVKNRHADSHDVLALFQLASDFTEMSTTPVTFTHFLSIMKDRHAVLMKERPEKRPGLFKEEVNRVGNTIFVAPTAVLGTFRRGFEIYQTVKEGMPRALFMMSLITEVHPFDDGNGRIARIVENSELVAAEQFKCIVPTAHRESYLNGLRRSSRDKQFQVLCKVIDQAHAYTESINWSDYGEARSKLEQDMADKEPDEGLPRFNRALRDLLLSDIPV